MTWSASASGGDPPAVVADHRDRPQPAPPRLLERADHVDRVAARREREQDVARAPVGDHLAREDRLRPDVVGDRGQDRRVLGEVDRAPRRQRAAPGGGSRRRRPSRRSPSRRCRARAASRPRRATRARRAAAAASSAAFSVSVCSRSSRDVAGLREHRAAHVVDDRLEVALLLAEERVEEARRAGVVDRPRLAALEQAAVLEEHVHELPEHVVERLDQLLADGRVVARRRELPLRAGARRRRSSGSRARGRARVAAPISAARRRSRSRCRRARATSSASRSSAAASATTPIAGSARLPTITGWTNSTATWRTSRARAGRASERDEPPAAPRSARPCGGRAARGARPRLRRTPALARVRSASAARRGRRTPSGAGAHAASRRGLRAHRLRLEPCRATRRGPRRSAR